MAGKLGRIRREMDKLSPEFYMKLHPIIQEQSLYGKSLKSERVRKVMAPAVNFIRSHGLSQSQFQSFLSEICAG
jgi:hypothetical protein